MQRIKLGLHLNTQKVNDGLPKVRVVLSRDDQDLIELCKEGDRRAQKALYNKFAPKMFAVCLRYMGDRDLAEDVLQDGFVTLFSKLDSYSSEGSFEGWVRKIFVNTALMSLRKNDVLKESEDIEASFDVKSDDVSAIQKMSYKELLVLISELPTGFRTVFNMYVLEGYSHKEIGEMLNISENTSRSQLQRARLMLQKKILKK